MRYWIYKALCAVVLDGTYSNLYLKDHLKEVKPKDQALASRIFYGTLQNYSLCETVWKQYVDRKVDKNLRVLLTMSVYQLLFLSKVPKYAIINDAVDIAKKVNPKASGLVNAVLRKVNTKDIAWPVDLRKKTAMRYSVPEWLMSLWTSQYGLEKAAAFAKATTAILPVYARINPLKMNVDEALANPDLEKSEFRDLYIYKGSSIESNPLYKEGKISIQDVGSYAIARFCDPKPGMKVLDCCAAPGTKALALAEMMDNQGEITATDIHEHRVKLIEAAAKRLGITIVHAKKADATKLEGLGDFDLILADVPCTGYGVMARKPDLKLKVDNRDIDKLVEVQKEILNACADHLRSGGILVYSTCTLDKKENEKQIEHFLESHENFRLEKEETIYANNKNGGFYMARLKKEI